MTDLDTKIDEIIDNYMLSSMEVPARKQARQAIKDLIEQERNEAFNEGCAYEASKGAGR